MQRRVFIATAVSWLKAVGLALVAPNFIRMGMAQAVESTQVNETIPLDVSLRELVAKKWHHGPKRFRSPFPDANHGGLWRVLKWKLFSKNQHKPLYTKERVVPVSIDWTKITAHRGVAVTFINHGSVLINDNQRTFLVDPVFDGLFPTIKDFSPLQFDIKAMPAPDHVLVTHGHYDHLDKESLESLDVDTHVISPLGYNGIFEGLNMTNRHPLDWFESFRDGDREVMLLPCHHWTMRNPIIGPNRSLWGAFLLKTSGGINIFISGDTAYHERYAELGRECTIDLAIFNLGAYEPRWFMKSSHINPAETVRAFKELGAKRLAVIHWGTFRLGNEPVYLPPLEMKREMEKAGLADRLVQLNHGQTLFY